MVKKTGEGGPNSMPTAYEQARQMQRESENHNDQEPRWYGVSTGDGNNGVSHMFPDYYVFTDDPWELAERAAKACIKSELHDQIEIDGDEEVNAWIYDDPSFYDDYDPEGDYSDWESGPAPFMLDVFPLDFSELTDKGEPIEGYIPGDANGRAPMYHSITEALGKESVA